MNPLESTFVQVLGQRDVSRPVLRVAAGESGESLGVDAPAERRIAARVEWVFAELRSAGPAEGPWATATAALLQLSRVQDPPPARLVLLGHAAGLERRVHCPEVEALAAAVQLCHVVAAAREDITDAAVDAPRVPTPLHALSERYPGLGFVSCKHMAMAVTDALHGMAMGLGCEASDRGMAVVEAAARRSSVAAVERIASAVVQAPASEDDDDREACRRHLLRSGGELRVLAPVLAGLAMVEVEEGSRVEDVRAWAEHVAVATQGLAELERLRPAPGESRPDGLALLGAVPGSLLRSVLFEGLEPGRREELRALLEARPPSLASRIQLLDAMEELRVVARARAWVQQEFALAERARGRLACGAEVDAGLEAWIGPLWRVVEIK